MNSSEQYGMDEGLSAMIDRAEDLRKKGEEASALKEKSTKYLYVDRDDWERAHRDLDLGESTTVSVQLYPHRAYLGGLIKFVEESKT